MDMCYARGYCTQYNTSQCNPRCDLYYKLELAYKDSNIPKRYRYDAPLRPEAIDKPAFLKLKEIQDNIVHHVKEGHQLLIYSTTTGNGKAQPLSSKVFTKDGYVRMGDIKRGTMVFTETGELAEVIEVFPQGVKDVYEVTFTDGSSTRCCKEHLWTVSKNGGKHKTIQLEDILNEELYTVESNGNRRWKYSIPVTQPLVMDKKKLPLHPYTLGALLGDGGLTNTTPCFHNTEQDVVDKTFNHILDIVSPVKVDDVTYRLTDKAPLTNCGGYRTNRLTEILRTLGLFGTDSKTKFIPTDYLMSDIDDRLQLLQGLVDTDGYVTNKGGFVEYTTTSKTLADNVTQLVHSLGGTCSGGEKIGSYVFDDVSHKCSKVYRLGIKLPDGLVPFTSNKHLSRYVDGSRQRPPYRKIKHIELVGREYCQCIAINSPTHLYLTDSMIVTHNTSWATKIANHYIRKTVAKGRPTVLYLNTSTFLEQLRESFKGSEAKSVKQQAMDCDILILDDLGAEKPTEWVCERLYDIINHRYTNCQMTIATSNLSPEEIGDRLGTRIESRLKSDYVVEFVGGDRR